MTQKKVNVVLNAEGTAVDATKSVVAESGMMDSIKQRVPFLRDKDVAIVNESTTNAVVGDLAIIGAGALLENKLGVVGRISNMIG